MFFRVGYISLIITSIENCIWLFNAKKFLSTMYNIQKQTSIHTYLSKKIFHILKYQYFHTRKVSSLYYLHCQTCNISTSTWNISPMNFQVHGKGQANIEIVVSHFIISFKCWILEAVLKSHKLQSFLTLYIVFLSAPNV